MLAGAFGASAFGLYGGFPWGPSGRAPTAPGWDSDLMITRPTRIPTTRLRATPEPRGAKEARGAGSSSECPRAHSAQKAQETRGSHERRDETPRLPTRGPYPRPLCRAFTEISHLHGGPVWLPPTGLVERRFLCNVCCYWRMSLGPPRLR